MKHKIKKLFADCFRHLGVKAVYCNQNKEVICKTKVLVKRPDTTYSLGSDGTFTSQIASIEIRSRDVTNPNIGDHIKIGNKLYKIIQLPLMDPSNNVYEIQAIRC